MRTLGISILLVAASTACFAQKWELGGSAGAGFLPGVGLTSTLGSATTGFQSGFSAGAFVGQNISSHIGGEIHYGFLQSNLRLASGGTTATFSGMAHVLHYDLILHTNRKSRAQLFAAVGGGMKVFRGTGKEQAYQPLSQFAYFTKTQAIKPMGSFGGGIKFVLKPHLFLRTEFRDYVTPFPKELITPAPGAKVGSLLHDIVPMIGISYEN
jgi:hypothetical protein